jgi:hypothetical protein
VTALFDAQVWYMQPDDEAGDLDADAVRGEGESEYVGSLAHIFQQLRKDEHRIRLVDIRRMNR